MARVNFFQRSLAIIFLAIVCCSFISDRSNADKHTPMVSAHRGASGDMPENTLLAFQTAIDQGADFIEIDVRTTADNVSVIMHDSSLKRTTGLDKKVEAVTLSEVRSLSAGGTSYASEKVPTLEEVCRLVEKSNSINRYVRLYVDCKAIHPVDVIGILKTYNLVDSAVFYGDVKTLEQLRKHYSAARLMPSYPARGVGKLVKHLNPYALDVSFDQLTPEKIAFCHRHGIKVFSDLLEGDDHSEAYRKAALLRVDLIQTDHVSEVKKIIGHLQ